MKVMKKERLYAKFLFEVNLYLFLDENNRFSHHWCWGDLWDILESHHIGPESFHFLEVGSDEGWSWVHLHGVGKLNDVALLEPVLRVEVLLGEVWSLRPLEAFVGGVHDFECGCLVILGDEEIAGIRPGPQPSEDPVEESVPLGHGKLRSEHVSELQLAQLSYLVLVDLVSHWLCEPKHEGPALFNFCFF